MNDSEEDDPSSCSVVQSSFNSTEPKKPTKVFSSYQPWGDFPEAAKQMIIDYNKKIKVPNPKQHFNGGNTKPHSSLGQPNPKPKQIHFVILLIILPKKLLVKPWCMNVYLMVE